MASENFPNHKNESENHENEIPSFSFHHHRVCPRNFSSTMIKCGEGSTQSRMCRVCGGHPRYRRWHTVLPENGRLFKFLKREEFALDPSPKNREILNDNEDGKKKINNYKRKFFNASCDESSLAKSVNRPHDGADDGDDTGDSGSGMIGSG